MNAGTGAILYEKNMHQPHYPASITKIATALYALNKVPGDLQVMIAADQDCVGTVTEEALRKSRYTLPAYLLIPGGSHIGIKKGEILSLQDLLYGMMLASGDDAANVIAKYAGGTVPQFMEEVNRYIRKIGCRNTVFYNPHGLHHPKQLTTAYDMAILTCEALKNPKFREIVKTVSYKRPKTNKQEASNLVQTNRLLRKGPYHYPKAIGVKTGYYSIAGSTLVAAACDGERTLIAVLLKTQERKDIFNDAKMMFETAFNQPKIQRVLFYKGPQAFVFENGNIPIKIGTYLKQDVALDYYPAEEPQVTCVLSWDEQVSLPVEKDQHVGDLLVRAHGKTVSAHPLYTQEAVHPTFVSQLQNLSKLDKSNVFLLKIIGASLLIAFFCFLVLQLKRRRK